MSQVISENACRNCRRPISYLRGIGWVHEELPQYAHEESTCGVPYPVDWHCPVCDEPRTNDQDHRVDRHNSRDGTPCSGSRQRGVPPLGVQDGDES